MYSHPGLSFCVSYGRCLDSTRSVRGGRALSLCPERLREVVQEAEAGFALLVLESVHGSREACHDLDLASASPSSRSAWRALSRRSSAIAAWFANRPSRSISARLKRVCSGGRAPAARRARAPRAAAGPPSAPSGRSPSPPRRRARSAGRSRRPRSRAAAGSTSTQPAMPVPDGNRCPTSVSAPSPATASNTSSSVSSSSRKIDDALAPKIARATSTIERAARGSAPRRRARRPRPPRAGRSSAHRATSNVRRRSGSSTLFSWNGVSSGCFAEDQRADAGHVRRREAVARSQRMRRAAEPRDVDVDAAGEELDRRIGL